jgi:OmcA/MtrC family decaheme c-type cytochrome
MFRRVLTLIITAGAVTVSGSRQGVITVGPRGPGSAQATYSVYQKEHYLSAEDFSYVRPGLNISIVGVTNAAPGKNPVVELRMTDDFQQPLDRNGAVTPGTIAAEFVLGQWNAANYEYINLTSLAFAPGAPPTPLHDIGGTWKDIELGHSTYTFNTTLPANLDVTQTLTLGIYASRATTAIIGKDYVAPGAFQTFRPDGGTATPVFAAIDTANCNTCHNPLSMHGQFGPPVQDVGLCVLCHTSQMPITATNQSLEFKVLVHKIHAGASLPSVQAGNSYVVSPGNDFSTVVFPQDVRNCKVCHASSSAADAAIWLNRPGQAACGSCHDDLNFSTGANHAGGAQINDASCTNCHEPDQSAEWDPSIPGAHTIEYKSTQLHGLTMQIQSVTQAAAGQNPVVKFQVLDKNNVSLDPRPFDTLQFTMGGPTTDYSVLPISEDAQAGTTFDGTTATYTFQNAIPANATGTWVMTCDVEWTVPLKQGDGKPDNTNFTESPLNPIYYMPITDAAATPRRTAVDLANCNKCHDRLGLHGGRRLNTQGCVVCHNPNNDDSSQRPDAQMPPESISFQRMIHRIHSGTNLAQDFSIYGHGGRKVNFNGVLFPGDRRDCEKCHVAGAETLPEKPPPGLIPTVTQRDYFSPMLPHTAACLGCHDNQDAAAHAYLNTVWSPFQGEACSVCHGVGAEFDVDMVHAR